MYSSNSQLGDSFSLSSIQSLFSSEFIIPCANWVIYRCRRSSHFTISRARSRDAPLLKSSLPSVRSKASQSHRTRRIVAAVRGAACSDLGSTREDIHPGSWKPGKDPVIMAIRSMNFLHGDSCRSCNFLEPFLDQLLLECCLSLWWQIKTLENL